MKTRLLMISMFVCVSIAGMSQDNRTSTIPNDTISMPVDTLETPRSGGNNFDFSWLTSFQPMEPTTASLGRYGEYPMDYSNGLPDISIPIYEIKSGDLTVPIVLRYQGGGIKVQQEASWVGLGWDLFYGGQITRVVQGFPDEKESDKTQRPTASYIMNTLNSLSVYQILNSKWLQNYAKADQAAYSFMPDEYYYNIGMESGKFIGKDVEALIPFKPINIAGAGNPYFEIINAKGEKYIFTRGETTDPTIQHYPNYTSAWHVSKIESPNKHQITYQYQFDGYYYPALYHGGGHYEGYYMQYDPDNSPSFIPCNPIPLKQISMRPKITCKKPEYIYFNGGRLQFLLSSRNDIQNINGYSAIRKLECIGVQRLKPDNTYEMVKFIFFKYFYRSNRLMLDRVYELSTEGSTRTIAKFEYDATLLPEKTSYNYDHYGYYNGSNNSTPIPTWHISTGLSQITIGGANKSVNELATKAGVLTAIEYPTKGKTVFTWENHRYGADTPLFENQYYQFETVSLYNSCTHNHDHIPLPIIDEECYFTMSHIIACKINQTIRITGQISRNITTDFAHNKYDTGVIKIENTTTGATTVIAQLSPGVDVINADKIVELKAGNNYIVYAMTNCHNISINAGFTYNSYNPAADKYNYIYGGLRIKEIANYDTDNTLLEKMLFTYQLPDDPGKSSGYITNTSSIVSNRVFNTVEGYEDYSPGYYLPKCVNILTQSHLFYDNPSVGIYPNNLSYQYVQKQNIASDGTTNGNVKYEFRQSLDDILGADIPMISKSYERGQLLKESIYDKHNTLLKETRNYYSPHPGIAGSSTGFKLLSAFTYVGLDIHCPSSTLDFKSMYVPIEYTNTSEWYKNDSTIVRDYFGQKFVENRSWFTYNDIYNGLPTSVVSFIDGKRKKTNYEYVFQIPTLMEELINNQPTVKQKAKYHKNLTTLFIDSVLVQYGSDPEHTVIRIRERDNRNNILQYDTKNSAPITCLWGYKQQHLIARIENASYNDVAYTSFEDDYVGSNWTISSTSGTVYTTYKQTGVQSFTLGSGNITKTGLTSGKTYIVSYWSRSTSPCTLSITNTPKTGKTINDWTYYEHTFTVSSTTTLNISGNGKTIDDLCLYPAEAMMTTYTYKPLVGVLTITDPSGRTVYYEYDDFGRLKYIKDEEGKLIKENIYNYAQ